MRVLIVDGQILQTAALERGMGRYTTKFIQALSKLCVDRDIHLLLNRNLPHPKEDFLASLGAKSVEFLDLPTDTTQEYDTKKAAAKLMLNKLISDYSENNEEIEYLISSPFFVDFFSEFPKSRPNLIRSVIAYDMIPYRLWHVQRIFPDDLYAKHFMLYAEADNIYTISKSVKDDLENLLGAPANKVIPIDGGPFMHKGRNTSKNWEKRKPYILMPSGPIFHKNNRRAIDAFKIFNQKHNNKFTLYITSFFDETTKSELGAERVQFTGNIDQADLFDAYAKADAVLFPSLAEGLGMPPLEATACGTPVACSNINVLLEMSETAFYFFNPTDVSAIAVSIEAAASRLNWDKKQTEIRKVLKRYTWENTAQKFLRYKNKPKPISKSPLIIHSERPDSSTPDGRFVEQFCLLFAENFDIYLNTSSTNTMPTDPSVAASLFDVQAEETVEKQLTVKRRSNFLKRSQILIKFTDKNQNKKLNLECKKYSYDEPLNLNAWHFFTQDKKRLSSEELEEWLMSISSKEVTV